MTISIRHAEPDDAPAIHRILSGPHAIWGTLNMPFRRVGDIRARLQDVPEHRYWVVACVGSDAGAELVGSAHLSVCNPPRRRHVGSLALAVRDDWHNKGVGSALLTALINLADNWLNLTRLELVTWVDNTHALSLYQHFGFVIEGTCRAFAYTDGKYLDAHTMARVRLPGESAPPVS
jgi:putative acetyltransferase